MSRLATHLPALELPQRQCLCKTGPEAPQPPARLQAPALSHLGPDPAVSLPRRPLISWAPGPILENGTDAVSLSFAQHKMVALSYDPLYNPNSNMSTRFPVLRPTQPRRVTPTCRASRQHITGECPEPGTDLYMM